MLGCPRVSSQVAPAQPEASEVAEATGRTAVGSREQSPPSQVPAVLRSQPIANPSSVPNPVDPAIADAEIQVALGLVVSTPKTDPDHPDHLFRLGEAYAQKAAWIHLHPDASSEPEADVWAESVVALGELLGEPRWATYARLDEGLYLSALANGVLGDEMEMQANYQRLIQDCPSSPLIAHAYLEFANYYYRKGKIGNAVRLYERVTRFQNDSVYAYALYRLGWCHLEAIDAFDPRLDKSLEYFVAAIEAVRDGRGPSAQAGQAIELASQDDLVLAYAQFGKARKAEDFLAVYAPGRVDALLVALARQYAVIGMVTARAVICDVLVARGALACG